MPCMKSSIVITGGAAISFGVKTSLGVAEKVFMKLIFSRRQLFRAEKGHHL